MLVLSRKRKQSIIVGDDVEIIVTRINSSDVRIGVKAPKNVKILRGELAAMEERQEE